MPKYRAKSFKVILPSFNAIEAPSFFSGMSQSVSLLSQMKSPTKKKRKKKFPLIKPKNEQSI